MGGSVGDCLVLADLQRATARPTVKSRIPGSLRRTEKLQLEFADHARIPHFASHITAVSSSCSRLVVRRLVQSKVKKKDPSENFPMIVFSSHRIICSRISVSRQKRSSSV